MDRAQIALERMAREEPRLAARLIVMTMPAARLTRSPRGSSRPTATTPYGFAYRKLERRMQVLGLELPPADELMPGPIG